jgi:hypothetical protein
MEMIYFAGVPPEKRFPFSDQVIDTLMENYELKLYRGRGIEPARA